MKSFTARAVSGLERRAFCIAERLNLFQRGTPTKQPELRALSLVHYEIHTKGFIEAFSKRYQKQMDILLKEANFRCYLGNEHTIPWHEDVVSGHHWDANEFYDDVRYGVTENVDVKNPWDRSRCHHLVRLGQAYALTLDEKYAQSFFTQVRDWISKNPRSHGVNWASPMEISIRACNWLLAWDFFRESPSLPDDFQDIFAASLYAHGLHIKHRIEHGGRTSTNHYVANLVGLAYIGVALDREEWTMLSERELEKEIKLQTHDDGMHYEASVAYHRLVTEMFFYFSLLSVRHPDLFTLNDKGFARSLDAMMDFTARIMDSAGQVPLIGDNDSGRFHNLYPRDDRDMAYLVGFGRGSIEESGSAWIFGLNARHHEEGIQPRAHGSSGLIALRQSDNVLVFSAQANGANGHGHHTHNDKLALTLSVGGKPFLIDPGTASYTGNPVLRDMFRSTKMHNTVEVDGEEQNRFSPKDLFSLCDDAQITIVEHKQNERIIAAHSGYERLQHWVRHGRRIEWRENSWLIEDKFTGEGEHEFLWTFHLHEDVSVQELSKRRLRLINDGVRLEFWVEGTQNGFMIENSEFAPAYRLIKATKRITLRDTRSLPFSTTFFIRREH
jgi:uncharacterized heparinase superfamily protein